MARLTPHPNARNAPNTTTAARLPCYNCKTKNKPCTRAPGSTKCAGCIPLKSRCNMDGAMPAFRLPALKELYLERLLHKNPTFSPKWFTEDAQIPPEVAEWDPPSTDVKLKGPEKPGLPQTKDEARQILPKLAERIQKLTEELKEAQNIYNGGRIGHGLQSEFPKIV